MAGLSRARWLRALALAFMLALLAGLAPPRIAFAGVVVSNLADDGSVGTLRQVLGVVASGETITFAAGLSGTIVLTQGTLLINKDVTINGPGAAVIAVSGNNASRVIEVATARRVTIRGVTIRNGRATIAGGVGNHGDLRLDQVVVTSNVANSGFGGGLYNADDATGLTIVASTVSGNQGRGGGGIFSVSDLSVTSSTITGNVSNGGYGGGILSRAGGSMTITNTAVLSNSTDIGGGGIYNGTGSVLVLNGGTIRNNRSDTEGGGLANLGQATITGTELRLNTTDGAGGGIYQGTPEAQANLRNLTLLQNSAVGPGGAIYVRDNGPFSLSDSTVEGNSASSGGGMATLSNNAQLVRTSFVANTAPGVGGGLYTTAGSVTVSESEFRSNESNGGGGAIKASGTVTVRSSLFVANRALSGGAIHVNDTSGTSLVENSTLSGNRTTSSAEGGGGGFMLFDGMARLNNVTIVANHSAKFDGAGGVEVNNGTLSMANTIIAGNSFNDVGNLQIFPDIKGIIQSLGHNLIGDAGSCSCFSAISGDQVGTTASRIDPLLGPLASNGGRTRTHALQIGSPAINLGSPAMPGSTTAACLPSDQRGASRPQGGRCDIGALEQAAVGALRFATQPSDSVAGTTFTVRVEALDASNNRVVGFNGPVTLSLPPGTGDAQLLGTLTVNAVNGLASFGDLRITRAGAGYRLRAQTGALSAESLVFNILAGPAVRLVFTTQPMQAAPGIALPTVRVGARDAFDNVSSSYSGQVALELDPGAGAPGAVLLGEVSVSAANGLASFSNLRVDRSGVGYRLVARSASLASATSAAFDIGLVARVLRVGRADASGQIVEELGDLSGTTTAPDRLALEFSTPMGATAASPTNYRLIVAGPDAIFQTTGCAGSQGDDQAIAIDSASYESAARRATLALNGGQTLAAGRYRLFGCPSLTSSDGTPLDGNGDGAPGDAFVRSFEVLTQTPPPWLVLIYLAGEDLDDDTYRSVDEAMALALNRLRPNPAARIVALYDGRGPADTRLYTFEDGRRVDVTEPAAASVEWTGGFSGTPGQRELNTGSALTLQNFIRWAKSSYPGARHTFLAVVDHGGGWAPALGSGVLPAGRPRILAGGWRGLGLDVRSASSLSTRETGALFGAPGEATHIDLLFYDACLMGMLEVAYEVRDGADYLVAGENLLFADFPYDDYLAADGLTTATTPRQLAARIVDRYSQRRFGAEPFAIAALDLTRLRGRPSDTLVGRVDALARQLLAGLPAAPVPLSNPLRAALFEAYSASQKFDYDNSLSIGPRDGYVDLADFAQRLATSPRPALTPEMRSAATAVRAAILEGPGPVVVARRAVSGRYEDTLWNLGGATGLSIFLPLGEQDWRPTRLNSDPNAPRQLLPEDQLAYYARADQLALTRDAGGWAALLLRLQPNTPIRAPGGLGAAPAAGEPVYTEPFRSPAPLEVPWPIFLPVVRR